MTMRKILLILGLCVACAMLSCGGDSSSKKDDAPAGHPDELKDSTRLDAAPTPPKSGENGPE
jgi:hypothetical protein